MIQLSPGETSLRIREWINWGRGRTRTLHTGMESGNEREDLNTSSDSSLIRTGSKKHAQIASELLPDALLSIVQIFLPVAVAFRIVLSA